MYNTVSAVPDCVPGQYLAGEGVGPHPVGEVCVLLAAVAALVALMLGKILHYGETASPAGHLK